MPPRILFQPPFKAFTGSSYVQNPLAALSLKPCKPSVRAGSIEARERRRHDPFLMAQSRQRKAANLSRRKVLQEEREAALGDPVLSKPTPFIQEIQALQTGQIEAKDAASPSSATNHLNYFLKPDELKESLEYSKNLTSPLENPDRDTKDPQLEKEAMERHAQEHRNAQEAINRIVQLSNGNTKDRTRVIIQKCIEAFGRHNTDKFLPPKPAAVVHKSAPAHPEKAPRVGPDTGSPEVQVAILTAKILNLHRHLQGTNKDKHNKRNLRLLVHKRQKLLKYLRRKERGGPRWQHLMETLGLSDAAWKGEISL
ncbi:putative ribosomal protein S15 [Thermoascus aurantiacus ATCC 26904]